MSRIGKLTFIGSITSTAAFSWCVAFAISEKWHLSVLDLVLGRHRYVSLPFSFDIAHIVFVGLNLPALFVILPVLITIARTEKLSPETQLWLLLTLCGVASAVWWLVINRIEQRFADRRRRRTLKHP